ncbi:DUF1654 domain-containing protein [Pseudomonas panipatensis]|uniref:DUF1654 domain-containing protein n=1 Tax=Pseudomonas panipatensis TaxID=428992 RepID=A0A1G8HJ59_9PSED|nr:DUF1654 domain-containing protein [Pseudomonas panipatensis]SDI06625.1 Protein of unknown function [Pseudomonas panipatensis]SMP58538.1 Protein of unknown function [Pseudomonas panipatensis]
MAKQKRGAADQDRAGMTGVDRLRLRMSAMINSPKAQSLCQATIWRVDGDSNQAWNQVMGELGETDGLAMTRNEDGTVTLKWEAAIEEGSNASSGDEAYVDEMVVQRIEEQAPF